MNPVQAHLPYPSIDNITPDPQAAQIISAAYAGCGSELSAICQYMYHDFIYNKLDMQEYADTMEGIAIAEMKHFDILGNLLVKLGVDPVLTANPPKLCNWFNTSSLRYSTTPAKMLMDDIAGETAAVRGYEEMLACLKNEPVAAVIQRILLDEQEHIRVLGELLARWNADSYNA